MSNSNGSLEGAYLILAARALGLAAGPMSGFNSEAVNREFFASSTWRELPGQSRIP